MFLQPYIILLQESSAKQGGFCVPPTNAATLESQGKTTHVAPSKRKNRVADGERIACAISHKGCHGKYEMMRYVSPTQLEALSEEVRSSSFLPAGVGDTVGPAEGPIALVITQRLQVSAQYCPEESRSLSQLLYVMYA